MGGAMKLKLICALVFAVIFTARTVAQEVATPSWAIVERCLPNPVVPSEDWTFDGEIQMGGWAGIHAVSAAFDTPYVLHWGYGLLSPNGQWVLNQDVETYVEQLTGPGPMGRHHWEYDDIRAENIVTGETRTFPWEAHIIMTSRPLLIPPAGPLWLDNTHFVSFYGHYGNEAKVGNLETGEIVDWTGVPLDDIEYSISPDQTRAITDGHLYNLSDNSLIREAPVATKHDLFESLWTKDSSMFVDLLTVEGEDTAQLSIFDRDGHLLAAPLTIQDGRFTFGTWSPTNEYFLFGVSYYNVQAGQTYKTYMLNMREQVIYNLCLDPRNRGAWSPDGTQFATILGRGQQPVIVVEMSEWQPYIVAYHTGAVVLWRSTE
jgi:hypothetical protein